MKNVIFVSGTYIAALIGAGLASGAETVAFFARYGKYGFLGIILCSCIFSAFIYALICGCMRLNAYTVSEYASVSGGRFGAAACEICILIFLMCVYSAMTAGAGEIAGYIYEEKKFAVSIIFNIICILIILMPIEKILNLCGILGLLLGVFIIYSSLYVASNRGIAAFKPIDNWTVSAISYSGYNILSSFGIMCPLSKFIKTKRQAAASALISGFAIFLVLTCLWGAISIYYGKIELGALPMLTLSKRQGAAFFYFYTIVLFAAIFTTAISSAYGLYNSISNTTSKIKAAGIIFLVSFFISFAGFDGLVNIVYRTCGILGAIIPIFIIKNEFKISKKGEN